MKLLPASILGRTVVIVALVVVFTLVSAFVLMARTVIDLRAAITAETAHYALVDLKSHDPAQGLESLLKQRQLTVRRQRPQGRALPSTPLFDRQLQSELRRHFGRPVDYLLLRDTEPHFWIRYPYEDSLWVGLPHIGGKPDTRGWRVGSWLLATVGVILLAAYLFAAHINRPLRRLVSTVQSIPDGRAPQDLLLEGPSEVRILGGALFEATRAVRQAARDQEFLLAAVSHDLRTPLARMRMSIEMLHTEDEDLHSAIVADIEEIDELVGQFLDFIRYGRTEPPSSVDVGVLVEDLVQDFGREGLTVDTDLSELPLLHSARPRALRRMLTNLLRNAFRHGAEPVRIEGEFLPKSGHIVLRVIDHGSGLDESQRSFLTAPPGQQDEGIGRSRGLGLRIVRRIAHLHGGQIAVSDRSGAQAIEVQIPSSRCTVSPDLLLP